MAYEPTQGVIVNGRIIDADDLMNEFTAISVATKENSAKAETVAKQAEEAAKTYSDGKLAEFKVDGGTF